jgi:hypothetical protein
MIKALLIVTALAGGVDYTTEMPSMKSCLEARTAITKQDPTIKTLCVPKSDDKAEIKEFFSMFMDIIDQIREKEALDTLVREENRQCPDCTESE